MSNLDHWVKRAHQWVDFGPLRLASLLMSMASAGTGGVGTYTLRPGDWRIRTGYLASPDLGNVCSHGLRRGLCASPLVLAGVFHPVRIVAYLGLHFVSAFNVTN